MHDAVSQRTMQYSMVASKPRAVCFLSQSGTFCWPERASTARNEQGLGPGTLGAAGCGLGFCPWQTPMCPPQYARTLELDWRPGTAKFLAQLP